MPLSCPTEGICSAAVYNVPYINSYGLNSASPSPSAVKLTCDIRLILSLPFFTQQRTLCFPSPSAFNTLCILKLSVHVPVLLTGALTSDSSAPLESTPASFVTLHTMSLYVALCGNISASISTCLLSGPSMRLPFTIRRIFRTGISSFALFLSLSIDDSSYSALSFSVLSTTI